MLERAVSAPGSHWGVSPDSSKDAIELTYRSDSSAPLSLHCGEVGCALFVEPRSGCSPGLVYPLLLNSSTQVGIAPSTCVRVSSRDASRATPRTGLLIGPDTEFVAGLFVGDSLSVAFPATAGGMEVLDVSAAGLPEAFASARKQHGGDAATHPDARPDVPPSESPDRAPGATPPPADADKASDAAIVRALRRSTTQHRL